MAKVRIMVVDIESGHTVKTIVREWLDQTAAEAALDVVTTLDTFGDCEDAGVEDE